MQTIVGVIEQKLINIGSKSERITAILKHKDGDVILRKQGNFGPAFYHLSDGTISMAGSRIEATGIHRGKTFIMSSWKKA